MQAVLKGHYFKYIHNSASVAPTPVVCGFFYVFLSSQQVSTPSVFCHYKFLVSSCVPALGSEVCNALNTPFGHQDEQAEARNNTGSIWGL